MRRRSSQPARIGATVALLGVVACGGSESTPTFATTVDTVAGVVHVRHSGRAPIATLEPLLSLGEAGVAAGEPSPEEFGRVRSVVSDAGGQVFVADGQALEIRVFGPDGSFIRRLGREGGGPGEMGGLHGAAWLGEDTLLVVDNGNARLMRLTTEGEHVDHWPWLRIGGSTRFYHPVGARELYAYAIGPRLEGQRSRSLWVRYTPAGPADSVDVPTAEQAPGAGVICRGNGIGFFENSYADGIVAAPAPGGQRVLGTRFEYRLAFVDGAGDTVRVLSRDAPPVPLTDADWDTVVSEHRKFRDSWAGAQCEGSITRPPHRPILRHVFHDHDGRLLVEHTTPEGAALDLFDREGRWIATLPLPKRDDSVPPFLRGDRLYLATRDSLGVHRVRGYRVTGSAADPGA